jgi:hypothetical protein
MFFNNYGVLGARVLAPKTKKPEDSTSYELKGQIPAIAGQAVNQMWYRKVGAISEDVIIFPKDVNYF